MDFTDAVTEDGLEEALQRRVDQLESFIRLHDLTPPPPKSPLSRSGSVLHSTPPPPFLSSPAVPKPKKIQFKLSSSVLTVTRAGMVHKSLAEILAETVDRVDVRGPDTPVVMPADIGSAFGEDDVKKSKSSGGLLSRAGQAVTSKMKKGSSSTTSSPRNSPSPPRVRTPPPSLDSKLLDRIATSHSLSALRMEMLRQPVPQVARKAMDYVATTYDETTNTFKYDPQKLLRYLKQLCSELTVIMKNEPMYVHQTSPCYTFGDTHGNYGDVSYFLENIINFLDLEYTPCNLIFLGDYVDRGQYGIEVLCLLLSLKLSNPKKVTLLRGNHEDPLVNGDVRHYGDAAFKRQCQLAFGDSAGVDLWVQLNELFSHFPLACDIDGKIFCCHGGIPRFNGGYDNRLDILKDPSFPHLDQFSTFEPAVDEHSLRVQMACDLCWSDPKDDETSGCLNEYGFGKNSRGEGVMCFGEKAVDQFCDRYGFQFIFRAHQEKSDGLKLAKSARVITIFSSSDYEGHRNGAGVLFVNTEGEIRMIMKSAWK